MSDVYNKNEINWTFWVFCAIVMLLWAIMTEGFL